MFIHISSGLIFLYLFFRLVVPLRLSLPCKAAAALALLLVSQQHLLNRYIFGGLSSPEIPAPLLLFQGWAFFTLIFLLLLLLLNDLFSAARWAARKLKGAPKSESSFSPGRRQALFLLGASIPAAYGVRQAVVVPEVRGMELLLPRLPAELDGLSLVQITDLHVSPLLQKPWVEQVVERVNALEPDLILFTGDMVDGLPARRAKSVAPLEKLKSRYGIYGCVGNHEYYSNFSAWVEKLPDLGISMLLNSHTVLNVKGKELVLAGVTDIAAQRFNLPLPSCAEALAGAPEGAVRILLDHRPGNARDNSQHKVDLQLSGHTHGGHIPGLRGIVSRFNEGYLYGWYKVGGMQMYVSSGAGLWNGFPVRLGVPSEIPRITLRAV